jgi:uncharacterized protein (TIGR02271 family)
MSGMNTGRSSERYWEIDYGWDVYAADGDKIGDVSDIEANYLVVSSGFIFTKERYVPVSAIRNVEGREVFLSVTKDELEADRWDYAPDTTMGVGPTGSTMTEGAYRTSDVDTRGHIRIPLVEEQLEVTKRQTEQGRVHIHKDVIEEQRTIDVPLREEEVHVQRRAVTGDMTDVPANAFEEVDIEIPVHAEEAEVTKRAVVREEVEIDKDVHERQERVGGTVRREEVHVEGDADLIDDDLRARDQDLRG